MTPVLKTDARLTDAGKTRGLKASWGSMFLKDLSSATA